MQSREMTFTSQIRRAARSGFTLIEVLVVVAIVALLVAILVPSLQRAREFAKVTICQANCKQIGTMTVQYQAEHKGYVPIVYNYYSDIHSLPARACWLSVALRHYHPGTRDLHKKAGGRFNPQVPWTRALRQEYEDTVMPDFFCCPSARGVGPGRVMDRTEPPFRYYSWIGRHDHYQTFRWNVILRDESPDGANKPWPGGSTVEGTPKYSNITWNHLYDRNRPERQEGDWINRYHRLWSIADAHAKRASSLAALTAVFCAQGEHMLWISDPYLGRANLGSHRTGQGGGTNAIFADSHVEWVKGTRIGWP